MLRPSPKSNPSRPSPDPKLKTTSEELKCWSKQPSAQIVKVVSKSLTLNDMNKFNDTTWQMFGTLIQGMKV